MIAKGHNFLHVGLVGVVCADQGLSMPDFRASEKTFQLLTQVAGRAGRGEAAGLALIQAFDPTHPSISLAAGHNVEAFIKQELSMRRRFDQPPFSRAALIRVEHGDQEKAQSLIAYAKKLIAKAPLSILGPAPSPIEKLNNRFRFQCLVLAKSPKSLHQGLSPLRSEPAFLKDIAKSKARLIIDIDPQQMS
jgi:primosomal protein N' (replication factor Y)